MPKHISINPTLLFASVLLSISLFMVYNRFSGATTKPSSIPSLGSTLPADKSALQPPPNSIAENKAKVPNDQALPSVVMDKTKPSPITYMERPKLTNAFIVEDRDDNICSATPGNVEGVSWEPAATNLAGSSLLPDCPPTNPNDSSETIAKFAEECSTRDHKSWPLLNRKVYDRVAIKSLKLLMTNRGCDETLEPDNKAIREELWSIMHHEYHNDVSILEIGGGCGHSLEWLTTFFAAPNATDTIIDAKYKHRPRFNMLTLDGRESSIRYIAETIDARVGQHPASIMDAHSAHSPSSIKFCQADPIRDAVTVGLRWSPSSVFNLIFVTDQLNNAKPEHVCPLVSEMVRVLKVGGAIWAGHIDNKAVAQAITECRLSDCSGEGGFTVEMTVIKESFFLGSPRFLTPKALLEKKPIGVMWRKKPLLK